MNKYNVILERKSDGKLVSEYLSKSSEDSVHFDAKKLSEEWSSKSGHVWRVKSYRRMR